MKLLEYEAKQLLVASDITIPSNSLVIDTATDTTTISLPTVIKSQVPVGGRGKSGGIKIIQKREELSDKIQELFTLAIQGFIPRYLLSEAVLDIDRELYILLTINRSDESIELIAHPQGGIEIESHSSEEFFKRDLSPVGFDALGDELADYYSLPDRAFLLGELVEKLYHCVIKNDATLLEINPLVLTKQGELIAGDCKMILDDAAHFRHPDWQFEEMPASANFVTLDSHGTVATIANGAGLAMATVDAVAKAGHIPANFLDIGGGATTATIIDSFTRISEFTQVTAIVINIFGGIVQCDTVAQAIIEARKKFPQLPRLYIRLSGNRKDEAATLLAIENLPLYDNLEACLKELAT